MTNLAYFSTLSYMSMMLILELILINLIHPALIIMLMLYYSMILCMNLCSWKPSYLYSILFFLIMISGLLIIFLYFSSLISNEKSWTPNTRDTIILSALIMMPPLSLIKHGYLNQPNFHGPPPLDLTNLSISPSTLIKSYELAFSQLMFSPPFFPLTLISMIYLLIALISIIKITSPKIKALRKLT